MVRGYIEERQRQEIAHDGLWDAYGTEEYRIWKENGNRLVTFKDWLKANKGSGEQASEERERKWERTQSKGQACSSSEAVSTGISTKTNGQSTGKRTGRSRPEALPSSSRKSVVALLVSERPWDRE